MAENSTVKFDLIVSIVNKGFAEEVVEATKKAGAEGGTIINGRGTGIHENAKIFGIPIEPEKEIVLTLIDRTKTDRVLKAVLKAVELNKPSKGVAFVLEVEKTVGICHLIESDGKNSRKNNSKNNGKK
jgi:nitrogen regulatory protein PII